MIYEIIAPPEALRDRISHFWTGTWDKTIQKPHTSYYVIAGSLTELCFAFDSNNKHSGLLFSAVQGHTHLPGRFVVEGFYHLIGVAFYSHALPGLFNMPAAGLSNQFLSLDTLLGAEGRRLEEQIAMAAGTSERIQLLIDHFSAGLNRRPQEDTLMLHALEAIRKSNGALRIEQLAREYCLSLKQFNRRFKVCSGFNPKTYSRVIRFEAALRQYPDASRLSDLAYANDYYDQAHFIHEFRSMTGFSPGDFRKMAEAQR